MFNVGGGELLVILLIALIVLGPTKLPEAARQIGSVARELRRMSSSFQAELKSALDDPVEAAARERGHKVVSSEEQPAPTEGADDAEGEVERPVPKYPMRSTAAAAGMYDVAPEPRADGSEAAGRTEQDPADGVASAAPSDPGATDDGADSAEASSRPQADQADHADQAGDATGPAEARPEPSGPGDTAPTARPLYGADPGEDAAAVQSERAAEVDEAGSAP